MARARNAKQLAHHREYMRKHRAANNAHYKSVENARAKVRCRTLARREYMQKWFLALRRKVIDALGGICECCKESQFEFLTLEHKLRKADKIFPNGKKKSIHRLYRECIASGYDNTRFTVLCMNCNWAERNGKPCPHKLLKALGVAA